MPWRGPEVEGEFPSLGFLAADWIEATLRLPDGPAAGDPFRLYDEQLTHLLHKYRLDPAATAADGNDAFRYGANSMLVRGQKWGKDPLLAAVDLFHAYGPCDFAGWDAAGEPVGKPAPTPWVAVAASNDEQTTNTWLPLLAMLRSSDLVDLPGNEVFDTFVKLPCGNPIEALTTTAWGRLGGRFTHVSITESGILIGSGPRGGLTFARTLKRNVGGMNGSWTSATNTWDPTEHSDAQETYEAKDPHVYVDARLARTKVALDDDEALRREVIYVYGDSAKANGGHVSEQRIIRDCRNVAYGESEVRRFYLSEITSGEKAAVDPARWAALARPGVLAPGEAIALGFDGSRSRDATALVASRLSDGRLFVLGCWEPSPGQPVPRAEVHAAVEAAFSAYSVSLLFGDPYLWQDALDSWSGKWPKRVVIFPTNVEIRMDRAIERFTTALRAGELSHDGHPKLAEHAEHAALAKGKRKPPRQDADTGLAAEYYLKIVKKREGLLIDLFVAAILAYEARGAAIEAGALARDTEEVEPWAVYA